MRIQGLVVFIVACLAVLSFSLSYIVYLSGEVAYYKEMAQKNIEKEKITLSTNLWPTKGRIVSAFGYRVFPWRGFHSGIDIDARYGTPVRASAAGKVEKAWWENGYGQTVVIRHKSGFSTLYAHNSRMIVNAGEKVSKGQVVAYVGNSGASTGAHCHFEVRKNGLPINPMQFLKMNLLTASKIF